MVKIRVSMMGASESLRMEGDDEHGFIVVDECSTIAVIRKHLPLDESIRQHAPMTATKLEKKKACTPRETALIGR